jgi:hypothetical protein
LVSAPRRADALLALAERRRAALLAWRESAFREAALRPSRFNARETARDRFTDGLRDRVAARLADRALRFVVDLALEGGGGSFTPARRAFDKPIAIACFVDRAPCLPSRTCSISSCTNSPACVVGALPDRLSRRARSMVFCSGMMGTPFGNDGAGLPISSGALEARRCARRMFGPTGWLNRKPLRSEREVRKFRAPLRSVAASGSVQPDNA